MSRADAQPVVPAGFDDQTIASVGSPTGLAFTPDGRLLMTTQPGRLRIYANGALLAAPALDLSSVVCPNAEQGLLGVAVDPAFTSRATSTSSTRSTGVAAAAKIASRDSR